MQPENACPGRDQLLALLRGQLDGEALEAVCQHLGVCANCDAQLAPLEEAEGGIVANLRRFHNREPGIDREEIKALEVKVKAISLEQLETPPLASSSADDAAATPPDQAHLTRLGKYRLLQELGKGGMGIVYAALHTNLNRKVAVKVIRPEHSGDSQMRARFKREMEAVGALVHPNIVAATDADEAEGHPFLVMELVDGLNLDALLRLSGPLPVAEACDIIRQAALGLQYVHEHQRVHRDLKPSNLMLSTDGVVKILDLGLARLFSDENGSGGLTASNLVMGTEDYMAPEQWKDSHNADIRADIYSLGCTGYKLLVGKAPFSDPEYKPRRKKKLAHALLPYPPVQSCRRDVPAGLAKVLERMLEKEPAARFATPQEVADALGPFAQGCDCRQLVAAALQRSAELPQGQDVIKGAAPATVGYKRETPVLGGGEKGAGLAKRFLGKCWRVVMPPCSPATRAWFVRKRWRVLVGGGVGAAVLAVAVVLGLVWSPQPDEPMQPGKLYSLLTAQRKPTKVFWKDFKFDHEFTFLPDLQELRLNVPFYSMVSLGKTDRAGYMIQLGIRQTRWVGGVGLFFGCHEDEFEGRPCLKCQLLELSPSNKGGFILERFWVTLERGANELRQPILHGEATAYLDRLKDGEWCQLEIAVTSDQGLFSASWKGMALPALVTNRVNALFTEGDYIGDFGTWNRRSESVYGHSHIMLFARNLQ